MCCPYPGKVWTIAEAKARLSEILRMASEEGPQTIGAKKAYVVVPADEWRALTGAGSGRPSLGKWLVSNMPSGAELEPPDRREPERAIAFSDDDA